VNNLIDPWWASTFETYDAGAMGSPVAMSYPFFDARVIEAALRVPSFPLCANKRILREAMRGTLPEAVRVRPKTPLAVIPESFHGEWSLADAVRAIDAVPEMRFYVDRLKFETTVNQADLFTSRAPGTLAAVSVATWLRCSSNAVVPA
jgi:asparagine synthase (glutamine-hydrolysing)